MQPVPIKYKYFQVVYSDVVNTETNKLVLDLGVSCNATVLGNWTSALDLK